MPKLTAPLSDPRIVAARGPCVLKDGRGLIVDVLPSGAKVWRLRARYPDGRPVLFTIGEYGKAADQFGIRAARDEAEAARALIAQGLNPTTARRKKAFAVIKDEQRTFASAAAQWLKDEGRLDGQGAPWSRAYRYQNKRAVNELLPQIGSLPLSAISSDACHAVIRRRADKAPWASLLRMTISRVFAHAGCQPGGDLLLDPTSPLKRKRIALKPRKVKGNPYLYMKDVPDFLAAVRAHPKINPREKIGLQLLMLTLVRPGELAAAEWSQFDLEGKSAWGPIWYVPEDAMKMDEPHLVPLSRQAVALLRELREHSGDTPFLFPLRRDARKRGPDSRSDPNGKTIGSDRFSGEIRKTEFVSRVTAHGLRATASTYLNSFRQWRGDAVELQLAHLSGGGTSAAKIRATYNHADLLDERRPMMQFYSDAVLPPKKPRKATKPAKGSNVVPFRRAA